MSDLVTNTTYLRATLNEALLDMGVRQWGHSGKSSLDTFRDSRVIEAILMLLDRFDALERNDTAV
jgi:hypothetical protein